LSASRFYDLGGVSTGTGSRRVCILGLELGLG
jgi:hypothetical protein